jgi:uncharacterized protein YsxB (DUF464 family)
MVTVTYYYDKNEFPRGVKVEGHAPSTDEVISLPNESRVTYSALCAGISACVIGWANAVNIATKDLYEIKNQTGYLLVRQKNNDTIPDFFPYYFQVIQAQLLTLQTSSSFAKKHLRLKSVIQNDEKM